MILDHATDPHRVGGRLMILVFSPSLKDHSASIPDNLGDSIIWDSVHRELSSVFGRESIFPISSHISPDDRCQRLIRQADLRFVGGSNLLHSDMRFRRQWRVSGRLMAIRRPAVLMGVGWQEYQPKPTLFTRFLLQAVLSHKHVHSVRDVYTENKLRSCGFTNVVNTSCPTLWEWAGEDRIVNNQPIADRVLLTLTDYRPNHEADRELVRCLVNHYKELIFWPQGIHDRSYGCDILFDLRAKVRILDRSLSSLEACLQTDGPMDYIGTRLHGGIKCLKSGLRSLILEVDNRAFEIGKETGLPTCPRTDLCRIKSWIKSPSAKRIRIPKEPINHWKAQFAKLLSH